MARSTSPASSARSGFGELPQRVQRRRGHRLQRLTGPHVAQRFARLLAQVLREPVDGRQQVSVVDGGLAERRHGVAVFGHRDPRRQQVAGPDLGDLALHHGLDALADRDLPCHRGRERRVGRPAHALQRLLHEVPIHRAHHLRLQQVHAERVGHGVGQRCIVGAVLEVRQDDRVAGVDDPLGDQRTDRADAQGPHRQVRDHGGHQQRERTDAAQCGVPPGEEAVSVQRVKLGDHEDLIRAAALHLVRVHRLVRFVLEAGHALLDERGGDDHRKPHQQEDEREARRPRREPRQRGHVVDHLQHAPRTGEIEAQHLPDGPAVQLAEELPERVHQVPFPEQARERDRVKGTPGGRGRTPYHTWNRGSPTSNSDSP